MIGDGEQRERGIFADAMGYPVRFGGWAMILGGGGLAVGRDFVQGVSVGGRAGVAGVVFGAGAWGVGEGSGPGMPYIGWVVATAPAIYSMMMRAGLIGLIYRAKRGALGWE